MGFSDLFQRKQLSIEDLSYLSKLLDSGMSLNDCLHLLKNKRNASVFDLIRKGLDQGILIEKLMPAYLPKEIRPYISCLSGYLSFAETLSLSLYFYNQQQVGKTAFLLRLPIRAFCCL